ncbi:MAG: AAA family ATPase, partial [Anaerolineales bacterium]|nr:AAA family ATPase [Anaerolineales bacterium]
MAGLNLSFLGPPHIELDGEPLDLDTRKNVALLAYLGVTAESHTREALITLLWPELEPSRARAVLRRNLSMLKKALSGEWLLVERETLGLEHRSDLWLDTAQFQQLTTSWQHHGHPEMQTCPACLEDLSAAAALYRGDFMAGFSLRDSAAFDEWQFYQTEGFRQEFAAVLEKLVSGYCSQERYKDALPHAQNWLSLDPLHESAQRELMRLYTWLGQRSAAIRQYKECERVLIEDLGVNPEEETLQLFNRIKGGQFLPPPGDLCAPHISSQQTISQTRYHQDNIPRSHRRIERVHIVGRKRELGAASDMWNQTLLGHGQTLLISGEAGIGKTRLVGELIQKIETSGGRALVGGCFMEGGIPYAPFRQIIREVARSRFLIDPQTENSLPDFVISALLTLVPELQLPVAELHSPVSALNKPSEEGDHLNGEAIDPPAEQQILFENLGIFFRTLSDLTPIFLVLEDVQWADSGTLQLMQYLARHTRQAHMMMLVTFRNVTPEEAPYLHKILLDLNREQIATHLDLPRLGYEETGELLHAIFSYEITPEFLDGIYSETEGNPFFIEEVCKALVESGKVYYQDGKWHRPSMEELGIPQNVRVAIQLRVSALPAKSQEALNMAAILGREFDFDTLVSTGGDFPGDTPTGYEGTLIEALENAERAQLID